jgi:hypothetical protein
VNNKLLSLRGNVEDLLVLIGYSTREQGNPDMKPNFYFRSSESEDFKKVRDTYLKHINEALATLHKSRLLEEQERKSVIKRPIEEESKDTPEKRKPDPIEQEKSTSVVEQLKALGLNRKQPECLTDGKRIFVNRLEYYADDALPSDQMLTFKQLAYKGLKVLPPAAGQKASAPVEVQCAVMHTMIFEPELIKHLLGAKIPITVFADRSKYVKAPLVERMDQFNCNVVYQQKFG